MTLMAVALLVLNAAGLAIWALNPRYRRSSPGVPWAIGGMFVVVGTALALNHATLDGTRAAALWISGFLLIGRGARMDRRARIARTTQHL
jgi:hypothetical protein